MSLVVCVLPSCFRGFEKSDWLAVGSPSQMSFSLKISQIMHTVDPRSNIYIKFYI